MEDPNDDKDNSERDTSGFCMPCGMQRGNVGARAERLRRGGAQRERYSAGQRG